MDEASVSTSAPVEVLPAGCLLRWGADNMGFREKIGFVAGAKRKAGYRQWCVLVLQVITRKMLRAAGLLAPAMYEAPVLGADYVLGTVDSSVGDKLATARAGAINVVVDVARALKQPGVSMRAERVGLVDASNCEAVRVQVERAEGGEDGTAGVLQSVIVQVEPRDLRQGEDGGEGDEEGESRSSHTMFKAAGWKVLPPWMEDFSNSATLMSLEAHFRSMQEQMLTAVPDAAAGEDVQTDEIDSPGRVLGVNAMTDGAPAWSFRSMFHGEPVPDSGPFRYTPYPCSCRENLINAPSG